MGRIETVLGPVAVEELGVTLPHEHILVNMRDEAGPAGLLNDTEQARHELGLVRDLGARTVVELSGIEIRGDVRELRELSRSTGLHIVVGTAFYREPYYRDPVRELSVDDLAGVLVRELVEGIDTSVVPAPTQRFRDDLPVGPPIRAGLIGELGWRGPHASPAEERCFRAAARAHEETGATISTHAARWPLGLEQLRILAEEGVPADRVVVGHCDTVADPDYHLAIAEAGAYVQFDTLSHFPTPWHVDRRVGWILRLVEAGYGHRVLVSNDVCVLGNYTTNGGPGYGAVLTRLVPALEEAGLAPALVQRILTDNVHAALAGTGE